MCWYVQCIQCKNTDEKYPKCCDISDRRVVMSNYEYTECCWVWETKRVLVVLFGMGIKKLENIAIRRRH